MERKIALKTVADFRRRKMELICGTGFWSVCHGL